MYATISRGRRRRADTCRRATSSTQISVAIANRTSGERGSVDSAVSPERFFRIAFTCAGFALPSARRHRLADQRVERLLLAGAELGDDRRVCGYAPRRRSSRARLRRRSVSDPRLAMIASASPSPAHIASNTSFAILPEIVPSLMRASSPRELRRSRWAPASMSISARFAAAETSPSTQFAASFGIALAGSTRARNSRPARGSRPASPHPAAATRRSAGARSPEVRACSRRTLRRRCPPAPIRTGALTGFDQILARSGHEAQPAHGRQLRHRRRARARSTRRRSRAAAGRDRENSGNPARPPCCASSASRAGPDRRAASPGPRCRRPRSARSAAALRTRSPAAGSGSC